MKTPNSLKLVPVYLPSAIPDEYTNRTYVNGNRTNTTLVCPIKLGALVQSYNVTWQSDTVGKWRDNTSKLLSLTLRGTIRHSENYTCHVTVTNPMDGHLYQSSGYFTVTPCKFKLIIIISNCYCAHFF